MIGFKTTDYFFLDLCIGTIMPTSLIDSFYNEVVNGIDINALQEKVKTSKKIDSAFEAIVLSFVKSWIGNTTYNSIPKQTQHKIQTVLFWYVFFVVLLSSDITQDQIKQKQTKLLEQVDWYVKFQELFTTREMLKSQWDDPNVRVEWHQRWCQKYETREQQRNNPSIADMARVLVYRAIHVPIRHTLLNWIMTRKKITKQTMVFPILVGKNLFSIESVLEQAVRTTFKQYDVSIQNRFVSDFFALLKQSFEPSEPYKLDIYRLFLQRGIIGLISNDLLKYHRNIKTQYMQNDTTKAKDKSIRTKQIERYRTAILAYITREVAIDQTRNKADINRQLEFSKSANNLYNQKDVETQILTTRTFLNFKPPLKQSNRVGYDKGCSGSWAQIPQPTTKLWFEKPLEILRDCSLYSTHKTIDTNKVEKRTISPLHAMVDIVGMCSPAHVDYTDMYQNCFDEKKWNATCYDMIRNNKTSKRSYYFWFDNEHGSGRQSSVSHKTTSQSSSTANKSMKLRTPDVMHSLKRFIDQYMHISVQHFRKYIGKGKDPIVSVRDFVRFQRSFARVRMPLYCNPVVYQNIWRSVVNRLNVPRPRSTIPVMFPKIKTLLPARTYSRTNMNLHYLNCQHFISWQYMHQHYRSSDDPLIKDRRRYVLFDFIRRFVRIDDEDQRCICRSCGTVLKLDRYLQDYQKDQQGRIIMLAKPRIINLKENTKYNNLHRIIDSLTSYLELLSERVGLGFKYEGTRYQQNQKRQSIIQDTIDTIQWTQSMESVINKSTIKRDIQNVQYSGSIYSTVELWQIETTITEDSSRSKMNVVICHLMVQVLLNLSRNDIQAMANYIEHRYDHEGTKNVRNVTYFGQWAEKLFKSYIIYASSNTDDTVPIMKYPVFAYLLFRFGFAIVGISLRPTTTMKGRMEQQSMWYPAPTNNLEVQQALRSCIATMLECLNTSCTIIRRINQHSSIQNSIHYDEINYVFERIQSSFYRSIAGDNHWFDDATLLDIFKANTTDTTEILDQYPELKPVIIKDTNRNIQDSTITPPHHVVLNRTTFWKDPKKYHQPYQLHIYSELKRARIHTVLEHSPSCVIRSTEKTWSTMKKRISQANKIVHDFALNIKAAVKQYDPNMLPRVIKDGVLIRYNENGNLRRIQGNNSMQYWYDRAELVKVKNETLLQGIREHFAGTYGSETMQVLAINQPGNLIYYFNAKTNVFLGHKNANHHRNKFIPFSGNNRFKLKYVPQLLDQLKTLGSDPIATIDPMTRRMNLGICIYHMVNAFYYLIQYDKHNKCRAKNQLYHFDMFGTLDQLIKLYNIHIENKPLHEKMLFSDLLSVMMDHQTKDENEFMAILLDFILETKKLFVGKQQRILYYVFYMILQKLNDDKIEPDTVSYNEFKYMLQTYDMILTGQVLFEDLQNPNDDAELDKEDVGQEEDRSATKGANETGYDIDDTDNDKDDIVYDADD